MELHDPEMDFYLDDESLDLDGPIGEVVLPYHEEDWEFGNENHQPLPYIDADIVGQWEDLVPYTQQQLASFYHNPLLERSELYTNHFLENSKDFNTDFKRLLITLKKATEVVAELKKNCEDKSISIQRLCQRVFDSETAQIKAEGLCQDQRKVSTIHRYNLCKYNDSIASELGTEIIDAQHMAVEDTALAVYTKTSTQLQCEQFLCDAATNVRHHTKNLSANSDSIKSSLLVKLADESLDVVRQCINTMFYFVRKDDYDADNTFLKLLENWIQQFVCLLFDMTKDGGYQNLVNEELYVINHIIRCPPDTQSWASHIVQISGPGQGSDFLKQKLFLDHVIHLLFLILRAPKGRGEFLSGSKSTTSIKSQSVLDDRNSWTFLDESGEDVKGVGSQWYVLPLESDMVSLYQQIPFEKILSQIFGLVVNDNGGYSSNNEFVSSDKFLTAIACCDIMCDVLGEGVATLGTPKYKQLVRRIAQTLRNIVLLMAEYWNCYKQNTERCPQSHSNERLQTEFDEFVKRCVERLLSVARLGVYQFLADLPFKEVSRRAAEMLYVLMNVPAGSRAEVDQLAMTKYSRQEWMDFVQDSDTKLAFEDRLSAMPENEIVYLLTTFCNLACARPANEDHLINIIAMDIYMVSFVYTSTRDICSKMGRELLCTVASLHPFVISTILQHLNNNSEEISTTAFYTVADLPFNQWCPTKKDVEMLRNWILNGPLNSISVRLVQTALKGMNWGRKETGCLYLPHVLHCEIALLLVEVCHLFETEKRESGLLMKSMDHVSRVTSVMRSSLSIEEAFQHWVWDILLRLKLHRSQLKSSENPEFCDKPAPLMDSNDGTLLPKSNSDKLPQACYVTIMMTNVGYSMNVFLQHGIPLLKDLVESGNKVPAVNCLAFIIPMFMQGNIDLSINSSFVNTLHQCVATGSGVLNDIANKIVESKLVVSRHLELLMGTVADSLSHSDDVSVLSYWLKLILATPSWWEDDSSKIFVDFLLKCAFNSSPECSFTVGEILYTKHRELMTQLQKNSSSIKNQNRSMFSSFLTIVGGGNSSGSPSFLKNLSQNFIYLSYYLISAEMRYENDVKLWSSMLPLMNANSVESSFKKAVSQLKLKCAPSLAQLAIYRWSQLIILTPGDHALFPAICQKFFLRFISVDPYIGSSMGLKFFVSPHDVTLFKKLGSKFSSLSNGPSSEGDYAKKLQNLFRTFSVWLDEEKLHDSQLYLPSLPSHYEPKLLASIRIQNQAVWSQYINYTIISDEIKEYSQSWVDFHTHKFKLFPSHSSSLSIHATSNQRVTQLLKQFESPLTLDPSLSMKVNFPILVAQMSLSAPEALMSDIEQDIKGVLSHAQYFAESKSKLEQFNRNYLELLPDLYSNEEQRKLLKIECQSAFSPTHRCAGPAQVQLRFLEKTLNEIVSENLKKNRASYREIVNNISKEANSEDFGFSAVHLITVIQALIKKFQSRMKSEEETIKLLQCGAKLFYDLADLNSDERWKYPPTRHLLITGIDLLGQVFIYGQPDQAVPLLEQMLKRPEMAALLSAHFSPAKSCKKITGGSSLHNEFDTKVFVEMYDRVVNAAIGGKSSDILFVLITKFDLESWCVDFMPPKSERIALLKAVIVGLVSHSAFSWPPVIGAEDVGLSRSYSSQLSNSAVQEVFLTHLNILVRYSPDQVFFEAVKLLLNASKDLKVDPSAWDTINDSVFGNSGSLQANQIQISYDCVDICVKYLTVFFEDEREKTKKSLYGHWEPYIRSLSKLFHSLIRFEMIFNEQMQESCEMVYFTHHGTLVDRLLPLFSAWLVPHTLEEGAISWPWTSEEQSIVSPILNVMTALVIEICGGNTVDAPQCIASLWTFYLNNSLLSSNKISPEYIISSYQTVIGDLPWEKFIPNLADLDKMVQLCIANLDCALHFLCHVLPKIDWFKIMEMCSARAPDSTKTIWAEHTGEILSYFLQLLLILGSDEVRLVSYQELQNLLTAIDDFPWHLIGYDQFDYLSNVVADKFHAFCIVIDQENMKLQSVRYAAWRLFQIASGMPLLENTSTNDRISSEEKENLENIDVAWMKRQSFVRCTGTLIRNAAKTEDKKEFEILETVVGNVISRIMRSIVLIIQSDRTVDEIRLTSLYSELWRYVCIFQPKLQEITKNQIIKSVSEEVFSSLSNSAESQTATATTNEVILIVTSILSSSCSTVSSSVILASVAERSLDLCLVLYSKMPKEEKDENSSAEGIEPNEINLWKILCHTLAQICKVSQNSLVEACLAKSSILTLLALAQNQFDDTKQCGTNETSLMQKLCSSLVKWISTLTPKVEDEPKLLMLVAYLLKVCNMLEEDAKLRPEAEINLSSIADNFLDLMPTLEQWSIDRVKSGILGSLGIGRASQMSVGFRVAVKIISSHLVQVIAKHHTEDKTTAIITQHSVQTLRKLPLENRVYAAEAQPINCLLDAVEELSPNGETPKTETVISKIFTFYYKDCHHFLTIM